MGYTQSGIPKNYSDYASLKIQLERDFGSNKFLLHKRFLNQKGTDSDAVIEESFGTRAEIGTTHLTGIYASAAADDNGTKNDGKIITMRYRTNAGVIKTATATITRTAGYQQLGLTGKTLATASGLTLATDYDIKVTPDGGSQETITINGDDATDYEELIDELNDKSTNFVWSLVGGDIRCTSATVGGSSTIVLAAGTVNNDLIDALGANPASLPSAVAGVGSDDAHNFSPAVNDFYCVDLDTDKFPITINEAADGDISIKDSTTTTIAKIEDGDLVASSDDYIGVGTIYGNFAINHNDGDDYEATLEYLTPWGDLKTAYVEMGSGDTSVATPFTDKYRNVIGDFRHERGLTGNKLTTANTGAFRVSNSAKDELYCGVAEGSLQRNTSRFVPQKGATAYIAKFSGTVSTNTFAEITTTFQPPEFAVATTCKFNSPQDATFDFEPLLEHKELVEHKLQLKGNNAELCLTQTIFEVWE